MYRTRSVFTLTARQIDTIAVLAGVPTAYGVYVLGTEALRLTLNVTIALGWVAPL